MATTGAALLAVTPGDGTLTAAEAYNEYRDIVDSDRVAKAKASRIAEIVARDLSLQQSQAQWLSVSIGSTPDLQGIAALMMLNLMEQFPIGEYGFHSACALHVMIEAKKLAYAANRARRHSPQLAEAA